MHVLPGINYHLLDKIRELGNSANHELNQRTKEETEKIYKTFELIMKTFENEEPEIEEHINNLNKK